MTLTDTLAIMKDRQNRLANSLKNEKCPGVLRKLNRQIRNLEKRVSEA